MTPETLGGDAGLTVVGFWEPGRSFNPLGALHLLAGERGPCARVVADATDPGAMALHDEMCQKMKTAVVQLPGGRREMHLCAIPIDAPGADLDPDADAETANAMRALAKRRAAEGRVREATFLCFETRAMAPFHHAPLLLDKQLVVIFDLDETLLQAFTMNSLERRAESLRRAHDAAEAGAADQPTAANDAGQDGSGTTGGGAGAGASGAGGGAGPDARVAPGALGANAAALAARDAKEKRRLREEDMSRLNQDRAMLAQFISENAVVDRRTGTRHEAKMEACATAPGEHTFRPVIRLPSPHVRGGSIVFTRIDPANRGTSMIIHTRPGWNELYAYLSGSDRAGRGDAPPTPRCSAYVCTMSEAAYAQEMWRLLDPRGLLIPQRDLQSRVVSVKQGEELKTIERATGGARMARELCVILDDRTSVWTENERAHILAVAPFMPYATDTGPGLKGEAPGEAGVLGAARRMIDAARMDVFMTFDKFAKFHAAFPNLPFEAPPNAGARSWRRTASPSEDVNVSDGEGKSSSGGDGAGDDKADKADPSNPSNASKSTRPPMPDAGGVLPQLMEKNAKQASNAIAQMGGAARSAAGAGSRLQAMLGGIAAPRSNATTARPIGARPTVVKSEEDRDRERREAAKREEMTERAKLQNDRDRAKEEKEKRERAKEEAAAALKIASEAAAARRRAAEAAAEAKARADAPADADADEEDEEENDMGLDSDEEMERKEAAYAEAGLGESSDDDDDDRVAAADLSDSDDDSDSESDDGERALADDARAAATRPGESPAAGKSKKVAGKERAPGTREKADEGRGQGQGKKRLCTQCLAQNVPREEIDHGRFCKSCPFHPDHEGDGGGDEKRKSSAGKPAVDACRDDDVPCMKCGDPSPCVDGAAAFVLCSNEDVGDGTPCQMGGHYQCLGLKRMPGEDDDWFCSEACLRAFDRTQKTPPSSPAKGKATKGKGKAPASEKSPRSFWKAAAEEVGAREAPGKGKKRKAEEERVGESQPAKPVTSPAKPPEKKFKSTKEQRANMLKKLSGKARK